MAAQFGAAAGVKGRTLGCGLCACLKECVIARRAKPDVAIRIPCDAKHRPVPMGPERERIATGFALAMTW